MTARINIVVALARDKAIGSKNGLLWKIPQDLKHFKEITLGHPIIMGRKTFESIGKALPNRTNIVITRDNNFQAEGVKITHSLEEAIQEAEIVDKENIFVIGGGEIYQQALPKANKLYLTLVDGEYQADTFFPDYTDFTKKVLESDWQEDDGYKFKFIELEKI